MRHEGTYYVACGTRPDGTEFTGVKRNNVASASQDALSYLTPGDYHPDGTVATPPEASMAWVDKVTVERVFLAVLASERRS